MPNSKARDLAALLSGSGTGTIAPALVSDQSNTSTGFFDLPAGTTAERPGNPQTGMIRFNTTFGKAEQYDGSKWETIAAPPIITGITYPDGTLAASPSGNEQIVINGNNFSTTASPVVEIANVAVPSVTVNSSSQITITTPAKTAGNYTLSVTNPSGLGSDVTISFSNDPAWNTAENAIIASGITGGPVNITNVTAAEGSDSITYSEVTSVLTGIMGLSLGASSGAITGTLPAVNQDTTYSFTLRATDAENQISDRQFRISVVVNYFGDGSDGSLST
jgi:hypothetical protein